MNNVISLIIGSRQRRRLPGGKYPLLGFADRDMCIAKIIAAMDPQDTILLYASPYPLEDARISKERNSLINNNSRFITLVRTRLCKHESS